MSRLNYLILLCCCAGISLAQLPVDTKLKVSVYYEALCPDSVRFIVRQIYPNYDRFANYINFDLVPYGKAIQNFVDGAWQFECQHGPAECYGNKIQACVLNEPVDFSLKMKFVNCIMGSSKPSSNSFAQQCASASSLNWTSIYSCANSEIGSAYLASYGDQTHSFQQYISFVPTVMYNDQFTAKDQQRSLRNIKSVICNKLGNIPECN